MHQVSALDEDIHAQRLFLQLHSTYIITTINSSIIHLHCSSRLVVYNLSPLSPHFFLTSPFHRPYSSHPNTTIIGIPTIIAVTRLAAGLYLGGNRMSGVGSMIRPRGREALGAAGAAKAVREVGVACFGEGARNGEEGRGMVVVRWLGRRRGDVVGFAAWDCEGLGDDVVVVVVVVVGFKNVDFDCIVPVARTSSRILLVVGVTGVGCCAAAGFGRATSCFAASMASVTVALSSTVLFAGVTGVACRVVVVGFGASFFAVVFVRAGAFFAFSTFSLTAGLFVLALLTPVVFAAVAIVPASSVTTFFGRPRFLTAEGSIVVVLDIVRGQLVATR